jgi:hypothetical protein
MNASRLVDDGSLRERFPEIPWDQPMRLRLPGLCPDLWACRWCIAIGLGHLPALTIYDTRREALDHIAQVHHD